MQANKCCRRVTYVYIDIILELLLAVSLFAKKRLKHTRTYIQNQTILSFLKKKNEKIR